MSDDFVKQQARSAAEDIFKAWLVAVQETSWSEKQAFIECVSAGIIVAYEKVGTLTDEIGRLQSVIEDAVHCLQAGKTPSQRALEDALQTKDSHPTVIPVNNGEYYECSKCHMELWPDQRDNGLRLECGNCGAEWWEYEPILTEKGTADDA